MIYQSHRRTRARTLFMALFRAFNRPIVSVVSFSYSRH